MAAPRLPHLYPFPSPSSSKPVSFPLALPTPPQFPNKSKRATPLFANETATMPKEQIVVVGAGISGLTTALALHRLGVSSLVLEQGESLRTGGTSLTLFNNGWQALDAVGVAHHLRPQFLELQGMVIKSKNGKELRSFNFKEESPGQEVRTVERGVMLQALAAQLPPGSIRFSSRLKNIKRSATGDTELELEDGSTVISKIVVGCDGIRSPIARWMGFSEPKYAGQGAYRGVAFYPEGQPFEPRVTYIYGRGKRAGIVPMNSHKAYWFVCYNSQTPGPKVMDQSILKQNAKELVKDWQADIVEVIDKTPAETMSKAPFEDRWLWPLLSPSAANGGIVLAGDAWHPMTPNLGQGACCALEDAVTLAGILGRAVANEQTSGADLALAFAEYEKKRWGKMFPLTIKAYLIGWFLQWENSLWCVVRDNIVVPKLVRLGPMLQHTKYECEPLTT